MKKIELKDYDKVLPDTMAVSVIMEKRPSQHQWADFSYQAVGVICGGDTTQEVRRIHLQDSVEQFLVSGLTLTLYPDECESYYHNMMSPKPGCFIVANKNDDNDSEMPMPYLVSLSFDEVHAYLEGDEEIYSVEIPPELYKWSEAYVLTHYIAIKKTKRKLNNWKEQGTAPLRR